MTYTETLNSMLTPIQEDFKTFCKEEFDCEVIEVPKPQGDTFENVFYGVVNDTNRTDRKGKQISVNDNILYKGKPYQIVWCDERLTFGLLSPDGIIQTFLANCNCDDIEVLI